MQRACGRVRDHTLPSVPPCAALLRDSQVLISIRLELAHLLCKSLELLPSALIFLG